MTDFTYSANDDSTLDVTTKDGGTVIRVTNPEGKPATIFIPNADLRRIRHVLAHCLGVDNP